MDIQLIETGDGGDFVLKGNDLVVIDGFQNMPYLGMFGGNIEQNTKKFNESEERFDWWANDLFMQNDSEIQFNSYVERLLKDIVLNSSSRIKIQTAVKSDLLFMNKFSTVDVSVSITSASRIEIEIKIIKLNSLESQEFSYIWDSTKLELTVL